MDSPCRKRCALDPIEGICSGCLRTLDEITRWGGMTEEQQYQVLLRLQDASSDDGEGAAVEPLRRSAPDP